MFGAGEGGLLLAITKSTKHIVANDIGIWWHDTSQSLLNRTHRGTSEVRASRRYPGQRRALDANAAVVAYPLALNVLLPLTEPEHDCRVARLGIRLRSKSVCDSFACHAFYASGRRIAILGSADQIRVACHIPVTPHVTCLAALDHRQALLDTDAGEAILRLDFATEIEAIPYVFACCVVRKASASHLIQYHNRAVISLEPWMAVARAVLIIFNDGQATDVFARAAQLITVISCVATWPISSGELRLQSSPHVNVWVERACKGALSIWNTLPCRKLAGLLFKSKAKVLGTAPSWRLRLHWILH
mmetsp:Transcript_48509/g.126766  ORF Transcript_48509/g.126766 Transcript_48509/m.126766 type:complete len:303 (-) Transcript_48509:1656-2564(-)